MRARPPRRTRPDDERAIARSERYGFEVEGPRCDHHHRRGDGSPRSAPIIARPVGQSRPGDGT